MKNVSRLWIMPNLMKCRWNGRKQNFVKIITWSESVYHTKATVKYDVKLRKGINGPPKNYVHLFLKRLPHDNIKMRFSNSRASFANSQTAENSHRESNLIAFKRFSSKKINFNELPLPSPEVLREDIWMWVSDILKYPQREQAASHQLKCEFRE